MAYLALYRKYRPLYFDDVKGQDNVVTALRNEVVNSRVGHAYILCGSRGTGKTTLAKIMAKAVNCEHPVNGNPCNECAMCRAVNEGSSLNTIEIDAASNNKVDNIRELIEGVRYSPAQGRYKVYIIDEVHMLSTGAFNALLKTLEEPPAYVVFILATTDVQKVPVTILSRCQRYDLKRIPVEVLKSRLSEIAVKESLPAEEKALEYIARAADGGMRDAISIFDKCSSFINGAVLTYDKTLEILGNVDTSVFEKMFKDINSGNIRECIESLDGIISAGASVNQFVTDFIWYLRNMLLITLSQDRLSAPVDLTSQQLNEFISVADAQKVTPETLMRYITILSGLVNELRFSTEKRVIVEMALIRMMKPEMDFDAESINDRISRIEKDYGQLLEKYNKITEGGADAVRYAKPPEMTPPDKEMPPSLPSEPLPQALDSDIVNIADNWKKILTEIKNNALRELLKDVKIIAEKNTLVLVFSQELDYNYYDLKKNLDGNLSQAIEKVIHKSADIKAVLDKGGDYGGGPDIRDIIKGIPVEEKNE